jgi:zinc transporter ZupT
MNTVLFYSLCALSVAWASAGVAVYFHREDKPGLRFFVSFGAGVLLGAAFLHMLPHAFEGTGEASGLWLLSGFLFMYLLEVTTFSHACEEHECDTHNLGLAASLGLSVHNFANGVALGAGAAVPVVGLSVLAATVAHKAPEFLTLASMLLTGRRSKTMAFAMSAAVALSIPAGALASSWFLANAGPGVLGAALAFSAGTFIHIGATDLAPEIHKARRHRAAHVGAFLLGLAAMALVLFWEHPTGG